MTALRFVAACLLLPAGWAQPGAPSIQRIEPPSWWAGGVWSPVRLLIAGQNLSGAKVEAAAPLRVSNTTASANGTYLFTDLTLPKSVKPGTYRIKVTTPGGSGEIGFEVLKPLDAQGGFAGFSPGDFMYLAMPDRFANGDASNDDPAGAKGLLDRSKGRYYHGGDLKGVMDRIPYLKELGATALWLNPWYENVDHLNAKERYNNEDITDYHGYGATDFYGVDEHLGTLQTLQQMTGALHQSGIKLIQDQVANHTGPYHPWATNPPTPTWFHGTVQSHLANDWQTWTLMDPHATPQTQRSTLDGWFIDILPDLNQSDAEARRYLLQNSLWWVGVTGLDGIRQDTLPYVPREYWREWTTALSREFPRIKVIGEVLDGLPAMTAFFQGGKARFDGVDSGVQSVFDFPLMFAMRNSFAKGQSVREVTKILANDWLYPDTSMLVTFLGLHDVSRFMSEEGATADGMKLGFTTIFTSRGIPMVYYGDEIGMRGGNDPDNRRDFPGGWKEDPRSAFTAAGRTPEEESISSHVKQLAALRRESPALQRGETRDLLVTEQVWVFARRLGAETVVVAINNGKQGAEIEFDLAGSWRDAIGPLGTVSAQNGKVKLRLGARSSSVLVR